MLIPPPQTPQRFATFIMWLCRAVAAGNAGGRLSGPLIVLIWQRINRIGRRFARLAARIREGRVSRRQAAPRPGRPAGPTDKLPKSFGWLVRLVPGAAASASQLEHLFRDSEMAALIAAAPDAMGRALRPLCRMLGVTPPPILALPPPPPRPKPPPRPRIPREKPEPGFGPSRPMGRVRYVGGLRYPPVLKNPA